MDVDVHAVARTINIVQLRARVESAVASSPHFQVCVWIAPRVVARWRRRFRRKRRCCCDRPTHERDTHRCATQKKVPQFQYRVVVSVCGFCCTCAVRATGWPRTHPAMHTASRSCPVKHELRAGVVETAKDSHPATATATRLSARSQSIISMIECVLWACCAACGGHNCVYLTATANRGK
jgi:hypothetical protein